MNDLHAAMSGHPYLVILAGLALGWLLRHRGWGSHLLPQLGGQPAAAKLLKSAEPMAAYSNPTNAALAEMAARLANLESRREVPEALPVAVSSPSASPAEAAHTLTQFMIDHPDQQADLLKIVGALTAKAAKKP